MNLPPSPPHRKRLRAVNYDYDSAGLYFVTICTHHMEHRFGTVTAGQVELSDAGHLIGATWSAIPSRHDGVGMDAWILMPNHLHGIVVLGTVPDVTVPTLGTIVGQFKSLTTVEYTRKVNKGTFPRFDRTLWQRGFHDHIIRSEASLTTAREYIAGNPARWPDRGIDS